MNITSGSGRDHACGEPESALLPGALAQRQRGQDGLHPDLPLQPVHPPPHRAARLLLQRTYRTFWFRVQVSEGFILRHYLNI